jgi:hypothetical protein
LIYIISNLFGLTKEEKEIVNIIPSEYDEIPYLFSIVIANEFPLYQLYYHKYLLKEGFIPLFRPIYSLAKNKLEVLKSWLEENLTKKFIWSSSLPTSSLILFVKKADLFLRLYLDIT